MSVFRPQGPPQQLESMSWDREYLRGRYEGDPPLPFVDDVISAARAHKLLGAEGIYVGCGNGRNYIPLVAAGLDLIGIDISPVAIQLLAASLPERRHKLVVGDLSSLQPDVAFDIVVGIQVFQHGDAVTAHRHIDEAKRRVRPGGLLCLRVNAASSDIEYRHDRLESSGHAGFTVKYLEGPKEGLLVRFFAERELLELFDGWEPVLPLRSQTTWRDPAERGQWTQWEAIWRRRPPLPSTAI